MPEPTLSPIDSPVESRTACHLLNDKPVGLTPIILELMVRNHPGTMSHITGLFARRAFNLEAIVVVPLSDGATSRILLHMANEPKLEQVERQLAKLHDVISVLHRPDLSPEIFTRLINQIPGPSV